MDAPAGTEFPTARLPIAVLASGRGSNMHAIIKGIQRGKVQAEIKVLITDNPEARAIRHARKAGIPVEIVRPGDFSAREAMDERILELLRQYGVQLVVLAGYMKIIRSPKLLDAYRYRMINIHPSLLPAFAGTTEAQKQAFEYGAKVSGLTIHFVTNDLDHGPILYQKAVDISGCKDGYETAARILRYEHKALCEVVDNFARGRYIVEGRQVRYERGKEENRI